MTHDEFSGERYRVKDRRRITVKFQSSILPTIFHRFILAIGLRISGAKVRPQAVFV